MSAQDNDDSALFRRQLEYEEVEPGGLALWIKSKRELVFALRELMDLALAVGDGVWAKELHTQISDTEGTKLS